MMMTLLHMLRPVKKSKNQTPTLIMLTVHKLTQLLQSQLTIKKKVLTLRRQMQRQMHSNSTIVCPATGPQGQELALDASATTRCSSSRKHLNKSSHRGRKHRINMALSRPHGLVLKSGSPPGLQAWDCLVQGPKFLLLTKG